MATDAPKQSDAVVPLPISSACCVQVLPLRTLAAL
jgi:hypothetical protein